MSHFSQQSEEHYLKTLYKLSQKDLKKVNNIALAKALDLNPATVLEMVRKLAAKNLVTLQPDKSLQLSEKGKKRALLTIRKHRLWEVFLVEKLKYKWNEVHELAEQLEHIDAAHLIDRLEQFLGHPAVDPHGDPIPDKNGKIKASVARPLADATPGLPYKVSNLADTNDAFLQYLDELDIKPGSKIKLVRVNEYDHSCIISVNKKQLQLSDKMARNILVQAG
jgi:DtxR family transcriptional regulator, Mn-dependent transcriptional regulator